MKNIVLMDGGLGQEIYRRAGQPAHPLWSAKVMMEKPEIVREVHRDFIRAGAKTITVNSYTATPTRLERDGQIAWFEPLQKQALMLAHEAREMSAQETEEVQIAGCLPPLIGSYATDDRSLDVLKDEYRQILEIQAPAVDILIIETISNIREAIAATEVALETDSPVLLSFTLSDTQPQTLRSGESLEEALSVVSEYPLQALLFNCSFPETISQGLEELKTMDIPYGGYANGFASVETLKPGGTVDALSAREDLDERAYTQHALEWIEKGATIVGGCCEVGPAYIDHLHRELQHQAYQVTTMT